MKTINQINGAVAANQTIQFYLHLCELYERYSTNWRHKYFKFKRYNETVELTPAGNFIYGAAMKELSRIIGTSTSYGKTSRQINFDIDYSPMPGYPLQFQVRVRQDEQGVFLSLETNFKAIQDTWKERTSLMREHAHKVRSSSTFADLDIKEYFERVILKKYLYAPGLFRNIQITQNLSKAEAIQWYKRYVKASHKEETDTGKAIVRQIKNRLNITVVSSLTETTLLHILNTYSRQKKLTKLYKSPSVFELSEQYANEYDTEDNLEEFVNEAFSEYPTGAILI